MADNTPEKQEKQEKQDQQTKPENQAKQDQQAKPDAQANQAKQNNKSFNLIDKYVKEYENPPKPKLRLPRMGCFWIFGLFLFVTGAFATGYFHTAGEIAPDFEIPDGRVTVSDTVGILLESDQAMIEALSKEIAQKYDCSVATMFIDARYGDPVAIYDQMAAEWAPGKGVLMVTDARNESVRFGLLGSGWRLAGWNAAEAARECATFRKNQRGATASALLMRLKAALDMASKMPDEPASTAESPATAAPSAEKKSLANMTDEEIEAAIDAEERAAEAEFDKERDPEELFAAAVSNTKEGILYSTASGGGDEGGSARNTAIFFVVALAVVAFFSLKFGKKKRQRNLENNPKVIEQFRQKWPQNKSLRLVDTNEYPPDSLLHKNYLKVPALFLGLLMGLSFVSSTLNEQPERDVARPVNSQIPDYPDEPVVDAAGVFGPERGRVIAAIEHLQSATGGEMIVYTVPTIGTDTSIEEFGLDAAMKWKIGKAGEDNGALLVLAIDDHLSRLEIGYGWEAPVNDARAGDLLRKIVPDLQAKRYADAAITVVRGVETFVTGITPKETGDGAPAVQQTAQPVPRPTVKTLATISPAKPGHDPRVLDPDDSFWGLIGVFGSLVGLLLAYWGAVVGTSAPHLSIVDPTIVYSSSYSGGSGSSSSRSSSRSSHSYSSSRSSSSHRSGGGGSFGGGGASGRW